LPRIRSERPLRDLRLAALAALAAEGLRAQQPQPALESGSGHASATPSH
jgi:hypothetical protein